MFTSLDSFFQICIFLMGAVWGSFANVVIYRYPAGKSVIKPRSHCYSCQKMIPWYFNIPLLSWLMLRGQCFYCKAKISIRYFLVELLMATFFVLAFQKFGFTFFFFESLVFIFALITASMIDFDHYILPDIFTLSGIVLGLLGALLNPERVFMHSLIGMSIGGGFLLFVAYAYYFLRKEEGIGGGDIKLMAWVGAILGPFSIPFVMIVSCTLGSIIGIALMLKSKAGMQQAIAFGPYISLAALIYLIWGPEIVQAYLNSFPAL